MKKSRLLVLAALSCSLVLVGAACSSGEMVTTSSSTTETTVASTTTTTQVESAYSNPWTELMIEMGEDVLIPDDLEDDLYGTVSGTGSWNIPLAPHPGEALLLYFTWDGEGESVVLDGMDVDSGMITIILSARSAYEGVVWLDWSSEVDTDFIHVGTEGSWTLDIMPMKEAVRVEAPERIRGDTDFVFFVGGSPSALEISGDGEGEGFSVDLYGEEGVEELVETEDAFDEVVEVDGPGVVVVRSPGAWSVTVVD